MPRLPLRWPAPVAVACLLAAAGAHAQPPAVVVRVRVVEPGGAPVPDATVTLVRGLQEVVAGGQTDAAGRRTLAAPLPPGDYQVVVRRVGHLRADRFFTRAARDARDTLALDVELPRLPQTLGTVQVTAESSLKQRRMTIDAEAIAADGRPLADASDIITKLRPDMIYGLGGPRQYCRPLTYVWINGRRITLVPLDQQAVNEARMTRRAQRATPHLAPRGRGALSPFLKTVLRTVRPEHVAEMHATDCGDLSVGRASSESALFITLKPGVAFEPQIGSYVVDRATAPTVAADPPPDTTADASADAPAVERLPAWRLRLIGIFDDDTGRPLADVAVIDVATGARTTTSATGTATLAHLAAGTGAVRLVRDGYAMVEVPVVISPADTVPITTLMRRGK